jgi:alkylated DNA repair protein alkB family protein 7
MRHLIACKLRFKAELFQCISTRKLNGYIRSAQDRDTSILYPFVKITPDVISQDESEEAVSLVDSKLKRLRYLGNHWDSVITGYREVELGPGHAMHDHPIIRRLQNLIIADHGLMTFRSPHVIDLAGDKGCIGPHIDSVKFSGGIVAGLSLLSTRVMRLRLDAEFTHNYQDPKYYSMPLVLDLLLPPRSLYVLSGPCRYHFTHEILDCDDCNHLFDKELIKRDRRISIILRDDIVPEKDWSLTNALNT